MAAVEAGLSGASVSITALGRALSVPVYIKHKIKRMDRLAGNRHLNTERMALYGAMTQWLLQSLPMPLILVDWPPLTADQHQQLGPIRNRDFMPGPTGRTLGWRQNRCTPKPLENPSAWAHWDLFKRHCY